MEHHRISPETHTLELDQLAQINQALDHGASITAGQVLIGVDEDSQARVVPDSAIIRALVWDGPPDFPYIYGQFDLPGGAPTHVPMHTGQLRELSAALGLRHRWGV